MAKVFLPPTAYLHPMTTPQPHPGNALYRHYRPIETGINVWLMPGGTLTLNDPGDGSEIRVFHGGHLHPVDDTEAAILRAAGYTVIDTSPPAVTPPVIPPVVTLPPVVPVVVVAPVLTVAPEV